MIERKLFEIKYFAGLVNINTSNIAFNIVVQYNTWRNFLTINTRFRRQVNI